MIGMLRNVQVLKEEFIVKIRKIRLSPKKGGNGFVSSYSVNIGSDEAKECGMIVDGEQNPLIIKCIDAAQQRTIIQVKRITFSKEIIEHIISLSRDANRLREIMMSKIPEEDKGRLSAIPDVSPDSENPDGRNVYEADKKLRDYLLSLSHEMITDIMTLMYIGRNQDANESLKAEEKFLDYWEYLYDASCFEGGMYSLVTHIADKAPLYEYLREGLRIIEHN